MKIASQQDIESLNSKITKFILGTLDETKLEANMNFLVCGESAFMLLLESKYCKHCESDESSFISFGILKKRVYSVLLSQSLESDEIMFAWNPNRSR